MRHAIICNTWANINTSWAKHGFALQKASVKDENNTHLLAVGYLLWIFGFLGAHRFYFGKPVSGTIWFFTLGLLGIGWLTSSTSIFVKDIGNLVGVLVQFGFWLTPVFWNVSMIPEKYRWLVELNPANYIISGYRDSLVSQVAFWDKPIVTLYYWTVTSLFLLAGISVFRKLKPHFAEVV